MSIITPVITKFLFYTCWIPDTWAPFNSTDEGMPLDKKCSFIGKLNKFSVRVITLGIVTGLTALFLNAMSNTYVGTLLGITALVTNIHSFPISLMLMAAAITIVGTAIFSTYLIETYS